jgi:serine phosphatase RsbU (regulator of sigma subunit)
VGSRLIFTLPVWLGKTEIPVEKMVTRIRDSTPVEPLSMLPAEERKAGSGAAFPLAEDSAGKVLIVDDEPINLQVLHNVLTLAGFRISQAHNGRQCLKILDEEGKPDLILLDVMMPGMTGFEVTRRIRQQHSANDLPILLVTAKNQVQDLEKGLESGANDYLTKPFSRSELLARMGTHLSLSRAHSAVAENRRKTEELEQARKIQLSLLPQAPPKTSFLEIAAHMQTATEVGGDYYDFFPQDDGSLYIVTGDATGHGIAAGMMVSMTKSALKALEVQSPHVLLGQLNRVIRAVHLGRMQMALNITQVTLNEVAVASAAMPPALLYRAVSGEVEELLLPGLPLGGLEETKYPLRVRGFQPGDVLLLTSDGLPEQSDAHGEQLGYGAVESCFAAHGHKPVAEVLAALLELGRGWNGDGVCVDDMTVVVVRHV